ncbi:putative Permease of the major facilitator superfamily [Ilyonectria robusta]
MGSWYKGNESRVRVTTFYLGQNFATATSSLLGAGLLKLDGHLGLEGWRWIFLGSIPCPLIGDLFDVNCTNVNSGWLHHHCDRHCFHPIYPTLRGRRETTHLFRSMELLYRERIANPGESRHSGRPV